VVHVILRWAGVDVCASCDIYVPELVPSSPQLKCNTVEYCAATVSYFEVIV
jgi:hypothetical protein